MKSLFVGLVLLLATLPGHADSIYTLVGSASQGFGAPVTESVNFSIVWDNTTEQVDSQSISATGAFQGFTFNPYVLVPDQPLSGKTGYGVCGFGWTDSTGELTVGINLSDTFDCLLNPFPTDGTFGDTDMSYKGLPIPGGSFTVTGPVETPEAGTGLSLGLSLLGLLALLLTTPRPNFLSRYEAHKLAPYIEH